jgi:pre-mRNA-processing factor SLU7
MSSGNNFAKRQEDAKKKQSGQLPPDLDKDGKMINPHNPDFLTKVPWYLGDSGPSLKHHTIQKNDHVLSMQETDELIRTIKQGRKSPPGQSSFKIGACRNCGATTHKEKDCVERPRSSKRAAWKTGLDIAPSEVVLRLEDHGKVNYSAKRDNWQGYDPENYQETVEKFNRLEAERVRLKQESKAARKKAAAERKAEGKEEEKGESESDSDYDSDDHEEEGDKTDFIERDESARDFQGRTARQGGVGGAQHKVTVRNLRLREDTPKYLHNLDLESAFYDPKARSMRENPLPDRNQEDVVFAGGAYSAAMLLQYSSMHNPCTDV